MLRDLKQSLSSINAPILHSEVVARAKCYPQSCTFLRALLLFLVSRVHLHCCYFRRLLQSTHLALLAATRPLGAIPIQSWGGAKRRWPPRHRSDTPVEPVEGGSLCFYQQRGLSEGQSRAFPDPREEWLPKQTANDSFHLLGERWVPLVVQKLWPTAISKVCSWDSHSLDPMVVVAFLVDLSSPTFPRH